MALQTATRDPVAGLGPAIIAWVIELALWLFMGLKLSGEAFSATEQAALIALLKVEGAVLFGLFFLLAPLGRERLGNIDA